MIVETLVCRPDGTQVIEHREVPDKWYESVTRSLKEEAERVTLTDLASLVVDQEFRLVLLELGV